MNHLDLLETGAKYLVSCKNLWGSQYVVKELKSSSNNIPDILGFKNGVSTQIEVKISRSDFLADKKKQHRNNPVGNYKFYLVPKGLVDQSEVSSEWGLLYYSPEKGIELIKKAIKTNSNLRDENSMMYSIIRRNIKTGIIEL